MRLERHTRERLSGADDRRSGLTGSSWPMPLAVHHIVGGGRAADVVPAGDNAVAHLVVADFAGGVVAEEEVVGAAAAVVAAAGHAVGGGRAADVVPAGERAVLQAHQCARRGGRRVGDEGAAVAVGPEVE